MLSWTSRMQITRRHGRPTREDAQNFSAMHSVWEEDAQSKAVPLLRPGEFKKCRVSRVVESMYALKS